MSISIVISQQEEFKKNARKHMDKAEKEKMLRTQDENKLEGSLYDLLRLSEQADTSAKQKQILGKQLKIDKNLDVDQKGRIKVDVLLNSNNEADDVVKIIRSLDGEVIHVGLVAYITCRIDPKKLRDLISVQAITRIEEIEPAITH